MLSYLQGALVLAKSRRLDIYVTI